MADFETYIVRAWAEGDAPPAGEPPLRLLRREADGTETEIAHHDEGVSDDGRFDLEGDELDLGSLLSTGLLGQANRAAAVGVELYRRLSLGAVGDALATLGIDQRVLLELRSSSLEALPWELLQRGTRSLFQIERHPWTLTRRRSTVPDPLSQGLVPLTLPLRVLLVIGHDPKKDTIEGDAELRALEDCFHDCREVLLRVLERPKPHAIDTAIQEFEPHVFHFIGHGHLEGGRPVLRIFDVEGNTSEGWGADRIEPILANHRVPRLVLLNACQSAAEAAAFGSLSKTFLEGGVGGLIAMQAKIHGVAALTFAEHLYLGLKEGRPIDVAMVQARRQVLLQGPPQSRSDWPIPRLILGGEPDTLVRLGKQPSGKCPVGARDDFVDRWTERHQACRTLFPEAPNGPRLVVLEGQPDSGKTELLKVLGETWSQAGNHALYVDLGGSSSSDLSLVVRQTAAVADAAGLDPKPLEALLEPSAPTGPPSPLGEGTAKLGEGLRAALETLTDRPLLLLLDGLDSWQQELAITRVVEGFCDLYLEPAVDSRVRVAIALPRAFANACSWRDLKFEPISVTDFQPDDWRRAAAAFLRFHTKSHEAPVLWSMARLERPGELVAKRPQYEAKTLGMIRDYKKMFGVV